MQVRTVEHNRIPLLQNHLPKLPVRHDLLAQYLLHTLLTAVLCHTVSCALLCCAVSCVILQRLPISLPELVESAPSLTADGSLILGRRDSKVFLLDRRTGRSVHTLSNAADALEDHSGSLGE